jgi:hypothetical protein
MTALAAAQHAAAITTHVPRKGEQGDRSMSKADLSTTDFALFHPAAHYDSPSEVLSDEQLSEAEKRVILSSWASDMFAVESCPGLRDIPGIGHPIRLADILAALRQLDGDDAPGQRADISGRWRPRWRAMTREQTSC